jgi:histidyl-tRNA synthetase
VVITGSEELKKGRATVRIMENKTQEEVPLTDLVEFFVSQYNKIS